MKIEEPEERDWIFPLFCILVFLFVMGISPCRLIFVGLSCMFRIGQVKMG